MFGRRFFGGRYYGPRYWGDGGVPAPSVRSIVTSSARRKSTPTATARARTTVAPSVRKV
jgi:hypothetical protein